MSDPFATDPDHYLYYSFKASNGPSERGVEQKNEGVVKSPDQVWQEWHEKQTEALKVPFIALSLTL